MLVQTCSDLSGDDFPVLMRQWDERLQNWIENSLNFLGYTFPLAQDLMGRAKRYLNMVPSDKAMNKERESLHELTNSQQGFKPVPGLIGEINRQLQGWANYFSIGYPRAAYGEIDWYVRGRLIQHLQRRSQRGFEFPKDRTIYQWFEEQGLIALSGCEAKRHIL